MKTYVLSALKAWNLNKSHIKASSAASFQSSDSKSMEQPKSVNKHSDATRYLLNLDL